MSRSWVEVDVGAIQRNVETLSKLAGKAELCAVVKADGYGHGAVRVAAAALAGGATRLAVAQVREGVRLREAGFDVPIWVLSEPDPSEFEMAARFHLEPAVYSLRGLTAAAAGYKLAAGSGLGSILAVHLKVDTGMHRSGAHPREVVALAEAIEKAPELSLASVWTHCAVADESDNPLTDQQMARFRAVLVQLDEADLRPPLAHAANSAATMLFPQTHFDVIRCGIAIYGLPPSPALTVRSHAELCLEPALRWLTKVAFVKRLQAGDRVSYGQRGLVNKPTTVVTLPVGYADGYRRGTWQMPGAVLIGGKRRDILGVVTMDQMVIDIGDDEAHPGDEVVLLGKQGDSEVSADDLAQALGTINYEIVCGLMPRVERIEVGTDS